MLLTPQQAHSFNLPAVNISAFHCVNAGGVDVAVTEYVGKAYNVFLQRVKCPREQVAEIVGEHLWPCNSRAIAQFFHIRPYIASVKRFAVSRNEYGAAFYIVSLDVALEHFAKLLV